MAAFSIPILKDSVPTTTDLSLKQYFAIQEDGTLSGVADVSAGVLQNNPDGTISGGATATVMREGVTRAIAGAVIAKSAKVAPDALGKMRTAVTGDHVLGIALEAAAADLDVIPVLLAFGGAPLA